MKGNKKIIQVVVLAAVLLLLLNPGINPLLSESTKATTMAELQANFGRLAGGTAGNIFTLSKLITVAAIIIALWLISTVVCFVLEKVSSKENRSKTVAGLFISVTKYASWLIALIWVLTVLGVNLTGIFASLGILSLVIGFGAQSLIEDTITGIFIIFEGQYNIGDIIILDDFRGVVKKIGVRTTSIEDAGGNIKIINNSDIRNLQNRSQNLSVAVCEVGTSYDARIEDIEKVILNALPGIYERNKRLFDRMPEYSGIESLGDSAVVVRVIAYVEERNLFIVQRVLNREMKILFDDNNIEIPFSQLVVHQAK